MSESPSRTVLHGWHASHGGKMVDFAGWSMPVQYRTGIIAEHLATRRGAGLFDVSHMGRYRVTGPGAESFLLATLTNNASGLDPRQAQYTFIANESGGVVDDAYLYRLAVEDFLLVLWRQGALLGDKPEDAFFVRCDRTTMTQNDIDNGRMICLVGLAPTKPAEFVIFQIGQWTADVKS